MRIRENAIIVSRPASKYVFGVLLVMLVLVCITSLNVGVNATSILQALPLFGEGLDVLQQRILFEIRLPRILLAACVGAILAISGAIMQGLFRNPLADPSLIGVTSGASLGASLVIVVFGHITQQWLQLPLLALGAFAGGALTVIVVYHLAKNALGVSVATLLLAGVGVSALAGSVANFLVYIADNEALRRISLWRMGAMDGASYGHVLLASLALTLLLLWQTRFNQALNAFLLGESQARHLGIQTDTLKNICILLVALGVGVCVALTGVIGFVGLVVPHIMRLVLGPDHRRLLPASAIAGAILLVAADTLARVLLAPAELPVGIITALIGVPFFLSLLTRRNIYALV